MSIESSSNGVNAQDMQLQSGGAGGTARGFASQADQVSWFEAMARAWGEGLDQQAGEVTQLSQEMRTSDSVGKTVELQAQVQRLSFLSESASNSVKSAAQAMTSLARKG